MRFHLLTVVWGDDFTDRFGRITLRSLLAPGNLPALGAAHHVVYDVYTTPADAERLRTYPAFKEAARHIEFRIHMFSLAEIDHKNPSSHWVLWRRGAALVEDAEDVLITVAADHLFAGNTLSRWAELFQDGWLAVFGPGVPVVAETAQQQIEQSFSMSGAIDLGLHELHALMFKHLHPTKITMFRDSPRWIPHPEELLRPVNGYGFIQNVLTSHAVAFRPRAVRVNESFCPVEKFDRIAFEPCRFLSLEPALKLLPLYFHPWRMDDATLNEFGSWADIHFSGANIHESQATHAYALSRPLPPAEHRRAELASQFFIGQMQATRQIFKVWRSLRDNGRYHAARWLATAHMQMRLRRRLALRLPATIFVPEESVLGRLDKQERLRLLASGGRALLATLRAHVAEGRTTIARGDRLARADQGPLRTMDGARYSVSDRGDVRVTAKPLHLGEIDIVSIDRPLAELALRTATTADTRERLVHSLRRRSSQAMQHGRSALLRLLQHSDRLYRLAADLRGTLRSKSRRGSHVADQVSEETLAFYRKALALRARDALQQLYGFYRRNVLQGTGLAVTPESRLGRPHDAPGEDACAVLTSVVRSQPCFAEAFLELGLARRDAGQSDAALEAFARASILPPLLPLGPFDPDPRIVAALERARLLMIQNRASEALTALQEAPLAGPIPRGFHAARARLLLDAGLSDEALDAFDRGMQPDHIQPSFAGLLPRNLAALEAELAATDSPPHVGTDVSQFLPEGKRSAAPALTGVGKSGRRDAD